MQVVELLPRSLAGRKLTDHLYAAVRLFVQVNLGALHAVDPEISPRLGDTDLRKNIALQIEVERIVKRKMANVFFRHGIPLVNSASANVALSDEPGR